jgi:hypothetical protein
MITGNTKSANMTTANISIRSNSGSDVKSHINDVGLEAYIVATSQRPL